MALFYSTGDYVLYKIANHYYVIGSDKMNHYTSQRRALGIAFLFSTVFIAISCLLGFCWEINDDMAIAHILSKSTNDYSPFQWRLLCQIVHGLYQHFPVADWWAICAVFAFWCSAFVYTYLAYRRYPVKLAFLVTGVFLVVLWLIACYKSNFTRTAAAVAMAGVLLIANSLFPVQKSKCFWIEYVFGCTFILFGASIRSDCALFSLAFLAVIGMVKLLEDRFSFKWVWFQTHLRQIILLCLSAALFFSASAINKAQRTPEQREFAEYNRLRAAITDYSSRYPQFQDASEDYLEAGWNEVGRNLFISWLSEDTDVYSKESLQQITKLSVAPKTKGVLLNLIRGDFKFTCFVIFVMLAFCCYKKQNWIYFLASGGMLALLCVYLVMKGRIPPRVYQSLLLAAICTQGFLCSGRSTDLSETMRTDDLAGSLFPVKQASGAMFVMGLVISLFVGIVGASRGYIGSKEARSYEAQRTVAVAHREILDVIDADEEHIYMFDIYSEPASIPSAFPFFAARPTEYCENWFQLGGWTARMPFNVAKLDSYGITNPMRALFERTDVYSSYSTRLMDFLRAYYDPYMTASGTKRIGQAMLAQYTQSIDDELLIADPAKTVAIDAFYATDSENLRDWYISGTLNQSANQERVFYCNVTVNGNRYTYRLQCEGGTFWGLLYGTENIASIEDMQIRFFEKVNDTYVEYSNVAY